MCPICRKSDRNIGCGHNAWAYFDGCITHLTTAPRCTGNLLKEDPLTGQGKSLIPSVATLLAELYPNKSARVFLTTLTIIYMAPGGHRQWPMSISALLECLSWLVLQARPLALSSFQAVVQKNPKWRPRYRCGPQVAVVPPPPIKFLDIGTKMAGHRIGDHIPGREDADNIFHLRFVREGIPAANTFHAVIYDKLAKRTPDGEVRCAEEAWFAHSPQRDLRVKDPPGYIWGLPVITPTCSKKLFALGPRKKYVDIVTDT